MLSQTRRIFFGLHLAIGSLRIAVMGRRRNFVGSCPDARNITEPISNVRWIWRDLVGEVLEYLGAPGILSLSAIMHLDRLEKIGLPKVQWFI